MSAIRVLIVDDAAQVRHDLCALLKLDREITVVGEAADGREAVSQALALQPQVVLMDLEMPILDGYAAARQIKDRCPGCRVIALTVHDCAAAREWAANAGVDVFIVKGAPVEDLLDAIQAKEV